MNGRCVMKERLKFELQHCVTCMLFSMTLFWACSVKVTVVELSITVVIDQLCILTMWTAHCPFTQFFFSLGFLSSSCRTRTGLAVPVATFVWCMCLFVFLSRCSGWLHHRRLKHPILKILEKEGLPPWELKAVDCDLITSSASLCQIFCWSWCCGLWLCHHLLWWWRMHLVLVTQSHRWDFEGRSLVWLSKATRCCNILILPVTYKNMQSVWRSDWTVVWFEQKFEWNWPPRLGFVFLV